MSQKLITQLKNSLEQNKTAILEPSYNYSYKELRDYVYFLSHFLNQQGFKRVAVMGEPCFITSASLLSVLWSQACYVPIEPSWPLNRINTILKNSSPQAVLTYPAVLKKYNLDFKKLLAPCFLNIQTVEAKKHFVVTVTTSKGFKNYNFNKNPPPVLCKKSDPDLAYIMYTSGSFGKPKGVKVPLKALAEFLFWLKEEFCFSKADRFAYTSSLGFGAVVRQVFSPILSQAEMCPLAPEVFKSPLTLLKQLKSQQITVFNAPPIVLQKLAQTAQQKNLKKSTLSQLRWVLAGGDIFPKKILELWYQQFSYPPQVVNLYGSTESIVNASCFKCPPPDQAKKALANHQLLPIGKARLNLKFLLKDENNKLIDKAQSTGELYIQSPFLATGYFNNKEETEKTFSFFKKQILYKTGDRAFRLLNQDYLLLGRSDRQVQIYGQRLELSEIENTLNKNPLVARAFVLHFKHNFYDKLIAFIQVKHREFYQEQSLKQSLKKELLSYMMPHKFKQLKTIPLNQANKVDYQKLKEMARQEFLFPNKQDAKNTPLQVLSDPEIILEIQKIWGRHLKILDIKTIPKDQSFFDCGGDSILAVNVYQDLLEAFKNVKLNPYVFYNQPTINNIFKALKQGEQLQNQSTAQKNPAQKITQKPTQQPGGFLPKQRPVLKTNLMHIKYWPKKIKASLKSLPGKLNIKLFSFLLKGVKIYHKLQVLLSKKTFLKKGPQSPQQKSFLLMKQLFKESYSGFYCVPIINLLNKRKFKKALGLVISCQESLRTIFIGEQQFVLAKKPKNLTEILLYDLKNQNPSQQNQSLKTIKQKLLTQDYDFSKLPLFKVALIELSQQKSLLFLTINHIIGDGFSLQAFLSTLNHCYAFLDKKSKAPKTLSYLDYTKKYKAFCRENFKTNQQFWDKQLKQLNFYNQSLRLKKEVEFSGEEVLKLDNAVAKKALNFAKKLNTQVFYIYLYLWTKSLTEFLNCPKLCFLTTYHGRDFAFKNLTNMIGSMARMAPVLIDYKSKPLLAQHKKNMANPLYLKNDKLKTNIQNNLLNNITKNNSLENLNQLDFYQQEIKTLTTAFKKSLIHKDFNILKHLLSHPNLAISKNWIGFNYLDFKPLYGLTKDLPFSIQFEQGQVGQSSKPSSYKKVYLFFSLHSYKSHIILKAVGKASLNDKTQILNLMKNKLQQLPV